MTTAASASAAPSASPVATPDEIRVSPGPALLNGIEAGAGLAAHRQLYGSLPEVELLPLAALSDRVRLRGRGGGAFPFAAKLQATAQGRRRAVIVVNLSESEPGSAKDTALAMTRPHLILDGAAVAARALGTREVHVALSAKRAQASEVVRRAIAERDDQLKWEAHTGASRFVAGQSRAVIELLSGRPNQPITARSPESTEGHRGRPTLLSNAETWAHLALLVLTGEAGYRQLGTEREPGTTLVTHSEFGDVPHVMEVAYGTAWRQVLPLSAQGRGSLVGGYHGTWVPWTDLASGVVSIDAMHASGATLGAGAVLTPRVGQCPLLLTVQIADYLAAESAHQCGPCFNGLPALARAVRAVSAGHGGTPEVERLARLVAGRGACSHPDGTVRMVASMLTAFPEEISAHSEGHCLSTHRELA